VTYSTAAAIFCVWIHSGFRRFCFVVVVVVEKKRFVRLIVVFWKEVPFFGTSRAAIWTAACFKRLLLLCFFVYFIYRSQWIGGIFVVVAIRVIVKFEFSTFATKRNSRIDPNRRQMKVFVLRAKDLLRW